MRRMPLAKRRAMRTLLERDPGNVELVAQLLERSTRFILAIAEHEGWNLDRVPEQNLAEKLRAVTAMLIERVEALGRKARQDGTRIEKAEIDGLTTMIKGLGTLSDITRTEESAQKKQIRRDEDLAELLAQINARIISLATDLAGEMAAENGGALRS